LLCRGSKDPLIDNSIHVMNTKWKIITLIMFVIVSSCVCFTALFVSHSNSELKKYTTLYGDGVRAIINTVQEQTSSKYQKRIKSFLSDNVRKKMRKAFVERDREELIRLTTPYFDLFKREDPYFAALTWILPDNTTYLHMHDSNKPSRNISEVRPDVVSANKTHQQYEGFATSVSGMQYRIVNPVRYDGKYVGVLNFGLQVSQLVDIIQDKLQLPVGMLIPIKQYERIQENRIPCVTGSSFAFLSSCADLFVKDFEKIDWSLDEQRVFLHDKEYIILKAVTLNNFVREPQGHIFAALDISEHIAAIRSNIFFIIIVSSILLLLSFLILYFGYDGLTQKILDLKVVEQVNSELENSVRERTKALQLSEKKFRSLVEELNDWVWEVDENIVYTYVSPTVKNILGFSPDEILGKTPFDLMETGEIERTRKILGTCIEEQAPFKSLINNNLHKDGHKVILETSAQPVIDEDGVFRGYRGVDRDITQRQQAEDALQAEKERLSVTLRSIGDAVITTDIEGKVIFLNKVAEELTGWTSESAQGRLSTEIFHIINERTGEQCASPVQRVLTLGRIIGLANHTALIAKDGSVRSIADSGAPIRDRESNIIGVVLVFRDVTHEKKTEEELLKIRKLESVGVLAGGIAHDFNNILSAILGNLELVNFHIADEDTRAKTLISDARKATKRAAKLTDQLLTFSKGGAPVKEEISLTTLVTEAADFVLHGSNVICDYTFPDNLWMADVDSGQIGQAVQNIIINAKDSMPEGGRISIQCANVADAAVEALLSVDVGHYVRITIKDSGVGIQNNIINKIFDPYFTTKHEGSGLGLAICHSIINKHDGHITVDSIIGRGTTFTIYLPAICSPNNILPEETMVKASTIKSLRILVMDDEEMLRNVARSQLQILGHEAVLVTDGTQAINRYQELQDFGKPVDIVLMDLTIPGGMGGQEAAEKLLRVDPEAKIIVTSGYSNDPVMANYKEYGFCAAVVKPFDLKSLSNVIASAI
jgi:PAS domain S-box-containing protein